MPTYDYECDGCGHKFELFQAISDPVQRKCPSCKKSKLRRLFGTGAAIMFKGSGFYQTDYRSESYKKAASAEAGAGDSKSSAADGAAKETSPGKAADGGSAAAGEKKSASQKSKDK